MKRNPFQVTKRKPAAARTSADGIVFDSVGEMRRFEELRSRFDVRNLQRQIRMPLMMRDKMGREIHITYRASKRKAYYTLDFQYEELQPSDHGRNEWVTVYEEYKGYDDPYSILRRTCIENYNEIEIRLTGPAGRKLMKKKASE